MGAETNRGGTRLRQKILFYYLLSIAALYIFLTFLAYDPTLFLKSLGYSYLYFVNLTLFISIFFLLSLAVDIKPCAVLNKYRNIIHLIIAIISGTLAYILAGAYIASPLYDLYALTVFALVIIHFLTKLTLKITRLKTKYGYAVTYIIFIATLLSGALIFHNRDAYIEASATDKLKALPYVTWGKSVKDDEGKTNVVKYDEEKASDGLNIFVVYKGKDVFLLDMSAKVLHKWSLQFSDAQTAIVLDNGDLLASEYEGVLTRLDWDSNLIWQKNIRSHHDVSVAENGDIYVLNRENRVATIFGLPLPMLSDNIVILSEDGETLREIDLTGKLKGYVHFQRVADIYSSLYQVKNNLWRVDEKNINERVLLSDTPLDIFHNNTITIIDRDIKGLCNKGDLIISPRELDLVAIMDIETEELKWVYGPGEIERQHHPTLLENNNILIFDNGNARKWSRVVEVDPLTKEIVWEYKADRVEDFFTNSGGSSQRLPNGNTLITDCARGRVFEVTEDGEIVWDFFNPILNEDERRVIYRMLRIADKDKYPPQLQKQE